MGSTRTGVMLAYPLDEKRVLKMPENVIIQRKFNGERLRIDWDKGKPVLYSSCGNIMPYFSKLKTALLDLGLQGINLDGELYRHGFSRETIHSIASRRVNRHGDEDLLSFHIFDIVDEELNQKERILKLNGLYIPGEILVKVESLFIPKKDIIIYADQFVKEGFEGIIVRHPQGLYTTRKTNLLLKLKPNEEDIYPIVGFQEEEDIHGWKKGRLGSVLVQDDDGLVFSVGTGNALDAVGRSYWWEHRHGLTQCLAHVKHSAIKTVNGFPTCTSLLEIEIERKTK